MSAPAPGIPETKNDMDYGHELPSSITSANGPDKEQGDEETDITYAGPLRLTIIMCTLSLSTLIAALDLVSLFVPPRLS